jgi:hypothetical protein
VEEEVVETTSYSLTASAPRRPDRRESERYLSLLRVGAIDVEGRRELCLIRNISAGGTMIRAYSAIEPGTALSVELKQGDPIGGTVQWTENGLTGITFDRPIDVLALLAPAGEGPRPRLPRIDLDCTAWVRQDDNVVRTRALNISQGGICVESHGRFTVDADVVVTLPGLTPSAGVVKWGDGATYGIAFNRALVLSELVRWLKDQQREERRRAAI